MKFSFESKERGTVNWEDGRLKGPRRLVALIRATSKDWESVGRFMGFQPHGPGGRKNYLRNEHSAYAFLLTFFQEFGVRVTITGEVPESESIPAGAVQ